MPRQPGSSLVYERERLENPMGLHVWRISHTLRAVTPGPRKFAGKHDERLTDRAGHIAPEPHRGGDPNPHLATHAAISSTIWSYPARHARAPVSLPRTSSPIPTRAVPTSAGRHDPRRRAGNPSTISRSEPGIAAPAANACALAPSAEPTAASPTATAQPPRAPSRP